MLHVCLETIDLIMMLDADHFIILREIIKVYFYFVKIIFVFIKQILNKFNLKALILLNLIFTQHCKHWDLQCVLVLEIKKLINFIMWNALTLIFQF